MDKNEENLLEDFGVVKTIISEGLGSEYPSNGCRVSILYTAKFSNGNLFDSKQNGMQPFEFILGRGSILKVIEICAKTMKKGEKCLLVCGPEYFSKEEYYKQTTLPINETLTFDLELVDWLDEDISPAGDESIKRTIIQKGKNRRTPKVGAIVKVHKIGKHDDIVFEDDIVEFDLNDKSDNIVIEGIKIALLKMCKEETSRLLIKPKYAFKDKGNTLLNIPPNATVEYTVSLLDFEKMKEWTLQNDERMTQAIFYKNKGKVYYENKNYKLAIDMYNKSHNCISNCERNDSVQLKLILQLNLALCNIKSNKFKDAETACNIALEIDSKNIKGLFRRGDCYIALKDFEKAGQDYQKILEIDSNNRMASTKLLMCKQEIKNYLQKEKLVYANMFNKFT